MGVSALPARYRKKFRTTPFAIPMSSGREMAFTKLILGISGGSGQRMTGGASFSGTAILKQPALKTRRPAARHSARKYLPLFVLLPVNTESS
jgi:hypothetical protein